jgi:excisionase family DNA binding protein
MLTVPEVARLLRIGRNLAYELVARGDILSRRLGRKILIPRAELEERFALRRSMPPNLTDAVSNEPATRHN